MNFTLIAFNLGQIIAQAKPSADQVETGFVYVIAAFIAVWLLIAAYLFWLQRRQEGLRQEVEQLRQEEAERQQNTPQTSPYSESASGLDPDLEVRDPATPVQTNLRG
jgi:CcmD family protein